MADQDTTDVINVLITELNAAREDATNAKIQLARCKRELAATHAIIANSAPAPAAALEEDRRDTDEN